MKLTNKQLQKIIRNVLIESYSKYIEPYPDEIFHGVKCVDCAEAFWDAGEIWSRSDDVNIWLNEAQGGDFDVGHPYEIIAPDTIRTYTYDGIEKIMSMEEALNFDPGDEAEDM